MVTQQNNYIMPLARRYFTTVQEFLLSRTSPFSPPNISPLGGARTCVRAKIFNAVKISNFDRPLAPPLWVQVKREAAIEGRTAVPSYP